MCLPIVVMTIEKSMSAPINDSNLILSKDTFDSLPPSVKNLSYHLDFSLLSPSDIDETIW